MSNDSKHDHRVQITKYADDLTDRIRESEERESDFLDVTIWDNRHGEGSRVEFLVTCGGPTVIVTVDTSTESAELFHSWGKNGMGEDQNTCDFRSDDRDFWVQLAEEYSQ